MLDLPWYAWAFSVLFWTLLLLRLRRRRPGASSSLDAPAGDDGPRWSPTRGGGF